MELSSVQRGGGPATAAVIDHLDERVQSRLGRQIRDFRLLRRNDGIVLQGQARTYYAKQLAQHAIMETMAGLPIVANEIEVR